MKVCMCVCVRGASARRRLPGCLRCPTAPPTFLAVHKQEHRRAKGECGLKSWSTVYLPMPTWCADTCTHTRGWPQTDVCMATDLEHERTFLGVSREEWGLPSDKVASPLPLLPPSLRCVQAHNLNGRVRLCRLSMYVVFTCCLHVCPLCVRPYCLYGSNWLYVSICSCPSHTRHARTQQPLKCVSDMCIPFFNEKGYLRQRGAGSDARICEMAGGAGLLQHSHQAAVSVRL